ncbi:transaldolase family protein [uncultured Cohaesibacter sp.]|uniref:transaldolase family protein n=1 Tax=uncultured Cohaesibacter sp. TaxID=1002546 RepID=UPI002931C2A8|nr:transaldolase family protein [uncultured Cohaesibacter sp.]
MIYFLDTADVKAIARCVDLYPVSGVTTNPSLIARENRPLGDILKDIRNVIGPDKMIHAQVLGADAETMIDEAQRLRDAVGNGFHVKIPVTAQGMKAIQTVASLGIPVTATAIVTAEQALMAAIAGASFTAPYVNRLDNICGDGVKVVSEIAHLFKSYTLDAKLLTASFKNVQQIHDVAMAGAHSATLPPELLELLIVHPLTDSGVSRFVSDWEGVYGKGATILDLI